MFWPVNLWFISTTIAVKGLNQAGSNILKLLRAGQIEQARVEVGKIVGRDTAELSEQEIIRATVETIAENSGRWGNFTDFFWSSRWCSFGACLSGN